MASETQDVEKALPSKSKRDPGMIIHDMEYEERLFHYSYASCDEEPPFMEFRLLQLLNIVGIQNDLAKLETVVRKDMRASTAKTKELRTALREYVSAIRDYDYMQKMGCSSKKASEKLQIDLKTAFYEIAMTPNEPYKTRYRLLKDNRLDGFGLLHDCLRKWLPRSWSYSAEERRRRVSEYYIDKESPIGISGFVDRSARFLISIASGASLIVPMVIMSLNKSLTKSLVTTSVAVLLFASFISFVIKVKNSDIITATAAYAAVLVVFVAVSSP